jgi:hypothetical protein
MDNYFESPLQYYTKLIILLQKNCGGGNGMNKTFKARISWIPKEQGGRSCLPQGNKYATIIQIANLPIQFNDTWSIVVENKEVISEWEMIALIKYLSQSAPNNLAENIKFSLYEGVKLVAEGMVLYEIH